MRTQVRTRVTHSVFSKIPFGAIYYLASDSSGPYVKTGYTKRLRASSDPQLTSPDVTVTDLSEGVTRVEKFVTQSQNSI